MTDTRSTATAGFDQQENSNSSKKNSTYSKEDISKRRDAVWRGEKCPRLVTATNMGLAISQLNIRRHGNLINQCWSMFSLLGRFKRTDDLGRESVWIDLKESRFDSMETCAKNIGLSKRAMEKVFQTAKELDIIRSTGASGKRTREYAFGDAMIKALTGEPTMHQRNKKPIKSSPKGEPVSATNYEKTIQEAPIVGVLETPIVGGLETPIVGALETPIVGVLVSKDLDSQNELKKKEEGRSARARVDPNLPPPPPRSLKIVKTENQEAAEADVNLSERYRAMKAEYPADQTKDVRQHDPLPPIGPDDCRLPTSATNVPAFNLVGLFFSKSDKAEIPGLVLDAIFTLQADMRASERGLRIFERLKNNLIKRSKLTVWEWVEKNPQGVLEIIEGLKEKEKPCD